MGQTDSTVSRSQRLWWQAQARSQASLYGLPRRAMWALDHLLDYRLDRRRLSKRLGYWPHHRRPRTFNEHVIHKKYFDRHHLLPLTADKARMREYVRSVLGSRADEHLVPLLDVVADPLAFDEPPGVEEYVLKANHASGWNLFITQEQPFEPWMRQTMLRWLHTPYGLHKHEWAYQRIPRRIVVEPLLRDQNGDIPPDYKLHVIGGQVSFIQVDVDRFGTHQRSLFDRHWAQLPVAYEYPGGPPLERPPILDNMVGLAEQLAEPFDYLRVDQFIVDGRPVLGELSHYVGSGGDAFRSAIWDAWFGAQWLRATRRRQARV